MFWGLVLEPGKRYAQTVAKQFHISMATLDVPQSENELVSVNVNYQNTDFVLCNLQKNKVFQTTLDVNFRRGDKVAFYTTGKGRVHLTGYLVEEEDDIEDEDEEDDTDEEQVVNDGSKQNTPVQANKQEKRKSVGNTPGKPLAKKSKMESEDEDEDDDEDDDGDSEIEGDSDGDVEIYESADDDEDGDEDEEDDDEDDDSDEDEDVTPHKLLQQGKNKEKQQSSQKQQQQQNKQLNTPNEMKKKKEKTSGGATPNIQANGAPESGKKNKKKGGETPGEGKGNQTPKAAPGGSPGQTPQKKVLEGGIAVEDTVIGSGQVAKPGRMVTVYYTGRLKQNNKKFDETQQGPGFKFRLGKGEVIKGWDIGLTGMKVGGKRKLTIPAHMAYGAKGSPPVIPPNSVLVFEVELRNVN